MKLLRKIPADGFFPDKETWELDNSMIAYVFKGNVCGITLRTDLGDITDQVYEKLVKKRADIKLTGGSCYFIGIAPADVVNLLEEISALDISDIKEGKTY